MSKFVVILFTIILFVLIIDLIREIKYPIISNNEPLQKTNQNLFKAHAQHWQSVCKCFHTLQ